MIPLSKTRKFPGYQLTQVERVGSVAIFEQVHKESGHSLAFEVVRIKAAPPNPAFGQPESYERYPGALEWGRNGWTCLSLADARRKAASLATA